jgi:hypothetical protein
MEIAGIVDSISQQELDSTSDGIRRDLISGNAVCVALIPLGLSR